MSSNSSFYQQCLLAETNMTNDGKFRWEPYSLNPTCVIPGAASGERSSVRLAAVHVVTEEEARSQAYSIEDVVMPLPGSQVQYPVYNRGHKDVTPLVEEDSQSESVKGSNQVSTKICFVAFGAEGWTLLADTLRLQLYC